MKTKNRIGPVVLVLAALSAFQVYAADWVDQPPEADMEINAATLPAPLPVYTPRSALSYASVDGLASNVDLFMSPYRYHKLDMEKSFLFGGVDSWGLNLGLGARFGTMYVGVSYGGSLVDELFKRVTNQNVDSILKTDETHTVGDNPSESEFNVTDSNGTRLVGEHANTNTLQILLGAGALGLKIGLSQYLNSIQLAGKDVFEFSLKPLAELGFHFKAGPVGVMAGVRGAFDFHNYSSKISSVVNYVQFTPNPLDPPNPENGTYTKYENITVTKEQWFDFNELSLGVTLGFDFSNTPSTVAEIDLNADAAIRFYDNNNEHSADARFTSEFETSKELTDFKGEVTSDLRISGSPAFVYRTDLSDLFTVGLKLNLGLGFDSLVLENSSKVGNAPYDNTETHASSTFRFVPDMGFGINVKLIPEHFSIFTGLGIEYFSLKTTTDVAENAAGETVTDTETTMGLPSVRLGAGFIFNFTAKTAMELLAVSKNLEISETKLTLLLTSKK